MMVDQTYVVDSDVFITAKNLYYSFDICPGFWKSVVHHHREGRVFIMMWVQRHSNYLPLAKAKFATGATAGSSPTRRFTAPPS